MTTRTRLPLAAAVLALSLLPAAAAPAAPAPQLYFADRFNDTITHLPITSDGSVARVAGPDRNPDGTLTGTGGPAHVPAGPGTLRFRLTPDGRHGYALNGTGASLSLFDVAAADGAVSPKAPATVATGPAPLDLAVDPRQRAVHVLRDGAIETYAIAGDGRLTAAGTLATDPGATQVVASPDGTALFTVAPAQQVVRRYALAADGTPSAAGSVTLADYPTDLVVTHDGTRVYVATGGSIVRLAADDLAVQGTTDALFVAGLEHLGLTPDDRFLVTTGDHLSVWQLGADGAPANTYASGNAADVGLLAFAPDGGMLYTLPAGGGGVVRDWILGPDQPTRYASSVALTHIPRGVEADMTTTPAADLTVTQALPATPVTQDGELTYKIVVANRIGLATGVRVRADLPDNLTLVSATTADGGACAGGGAVDCAVHAIGAGRTATIVVRARTLRAGTATLSASATALQPDTDPTNNAETSSTAIDPKPGAVTVAATDVTAGGARLTGVVAPAGTGTRYRFVLGDGTATPWTPAGDGLAPRAVAATVAGLAPGTTYGFRLVVTHDQGTVVVGDEAAFTTAAAPEPPSATPTPSPAPAPAPGPAPRGTATPDRTAPALSGLGLTATTLRLRVSEAAAGNGTVERARTTHVRRHGKRVTVTRWTRVATVAVRATAAGPVTATLPSRLAAGRYRLTLKLADAAGNRARPASTIVRVG